MSWHLYNQPLNRLLPTDRRYEVGVFRLGICNTPERCHETSTSKRPRHCTRDGVGCCQCSSSERDDLEGLEVGSDDVGEDWNLVCMSKRLMEMYKT